MLKETIYTDIITAMKSGQKIKAEALKMIKAEIMKLETSGANIIADDQAVVKILQKAVKQGKEAAAAFKKGGNLSAAQQELAEIEVYLGYLPEMMSKEEVKTIVQESISETGADSISDMGKVMKNIMPKIQGKADGKEVQEMVKIFLT